MLVLRATRKFFAGIGVAVCFLGPAVSAQIISEPMALPEGIVATGDSTEVTAALVWAEDSRQRYPDQAQQVVEHALTLARFLDYNHGVGLSLSILGHLTQDLDQKESYYREALDIFEREGNERWTAAVRIFLGQAYSDQGHTERSLALYFDALEDFNRLNDTEGQMLALGSIGNTHRGQDNLEESLTYQQQAVAIAETTGNPGQLIITLANLGATFSDLGAYEQAESHYLRALGIAEEHDFSRFIAMLSGNLGIMFTKRGHYERALPHLLIAEQIGKEVGESSTLAAVYVGLGDAYLHLNDHERALHYARESLALAHETGLYQMEAHNTLSQIYEEMGDTDSALYHFRQYSIVRDSVFNTEKAEAIAEMQTRYETEEKQRTIENLEHEARIQTLQTSRWLIGLMAVVSSLLLLLGILYARYRLKQKDNQLLKDLDSMRTRFFANISHEFRTPLTVILGGLQGVLSGRFGEVSFKVAEQQHAMLRNTRRLQLLIDEVLDLNRLESGAIQLQKSPGDIVRFLRWLIEIHSTMADQKGIQLNFDSNVDSCVRIYDERKLEKVVDNLLSNALKFTPRKGIIQLRLYCDGRNIEVSVEDNGPGIPTELQERIFDRFVQGKDSNIHGGTGIGLALAKELAELHGGTIIVESRLGHGTTFTLRLTLEPISSNGDKSSVEDALASQSRRLAGLSNYRSLSDNSVRTDKKQGAPDWSLQSSIPVSWELEVGGDGNTSPAHPPAAPLMDSEADQTTILIIEDNDDVRAYIRQSLEETYRVLEASDGDRGLQQARADLPDLIISDVMLPGIDGYAIALRLKAEPATECIPLVMLTARVTEEDHVAGYGAGAEIYITKPFSPETLLAAVARLLEERQRLRRRLKEQIKTDTEEDGAPSTLRDRIRTTVLEHLHEENFGIEELASAIGMSRYTLHRHVKQETGLSASDLVRTVRLEHAHQLLTDGAGSVSEVAYAVGFKSLSHFSHSFQKHFGKLPSNVLAQRAEGVAK